MLKRTFTSEAFSGTRAKVDEAGGDTSFAGRQHIKETKKLHPLVDPEGYDLIRKSWPRYVEQDGVFVLANGVPMLVENEWDTTGSMGENVRLAFESLPKQYDLLANGAQPVLGRYDPQILNAIFGDITDHFILARTQAEMDVKIAEQLTLMVPECEGGDSPEDPEYGLFGAAYLTDAFINAYGLKSYHFMTTDAPSHGRIDSENLVRVFGEKVFDRVGDNGHEFEKDEKTGKIILPDTAELVTELKKRAHAFAIIVGGHSVAYWREYYGEEFVVEINTTEYLAYVEAAIIGLTEGVLDLQSLPKYLRGVGCSAPVAREIQRAVANIPLAAQTKFPNFSKIPAKGTVFAQKRELWPIVGAAPAKAKAKKEETWL